ncbi:putative transposase [Arthrobacter sp. UYNi723]
MAGKFNDAKGKAGRDQLTRMHNEDGIRVSQPTVGDIMREQGLRAVRTRAWKKTTEQDSQAKTAHIENHMLDGNGKRDFSSEVPGTRLCVDITYLKTGEGWLYLATVIDLCTGMVIGWNLDRHMRTELCTGALAMARDHGYLHADGAVFHSDYAEEPVTQSMGKVGVCWDCQTQSPRISSRT